jgi:ubiquinone/menaquinone biosynthesis C-methylase UbiE
VSEAGAVTAYDVAAHYDQAYFDDLTRRYRRRNRFARQRIKNVFSLLPDVRGKRVLDVGCGMGTFTIETARVGAQSAGVDLADAAITAAQAVARAEAVRAANFIRADAAQLPTESEQVDVAIAADLTEHLDASTLHRVLVEIRRTLKPRGVLVIYTPSASHLFERLRARSILLKQEPSHIGVRTATQLSDAVKRAGFQILRVEYLPSHVIVWNVLERMLARWLPLFRRRIGVVALKPKS